MATNKEVRAFLNAIAKDKYGKGYKYLNNKQKKAVRTRGAKLARR